MWKLVLAATLTVRDLNVVSNYIDTRGYPTYAWEDELVFAVPIDQLKMVMDDLTGMGIDVIDDEYVLSNIDASPDATQLTYDNGDWMLI